MKASYGYATNCSSTSGTVINNILPFLFSLYLVSQADTAPDAVVPEKGREIVSADGSGAVIESGGDAKVAEIPQECLIKHPLHNTWTLWYLEHDRQKTWEDMQNKITDFDTVEDFWSLYNHIRVASEIGSGNDYSLFKRNIRPMWEDETNKRGGRWLIVLSRAHRRIVDVLWLDIVLCLIGEAFDDSEDICGAVVNIRPRGDKIGGFFAGVF